MMCDGGVRFMSDAIAGEVWARLVTPDGGRLVGPILAGETKPGQHFEDDPTVANQGNTQAPIKESDIP